jgi:hypothetical protein
MKLNTWFHGEGLLAVLSYKSKNAYDSFKVLYRGDGFGGMGDRFDLLSPPKRISILVDGLDAVENSNASKIKVARMTAG